MSWGTPRVIGLLGHAAAVREKLRGIPPARAATRHGVSPVATGRSEPHAPPVSRWKGRAEIFRKVLCIPAFEPPLGWLCPLFPAHLAGIVRTERRPQTPAPRRMEDQSRPLSDTPQQTNPNLALHRARWLPSRAIGRAQGGLLVDCPVW